MYKGSVEPLHVVALWKGEKDLIGQNRERQQEDSTHRNREREGTEPQTGGKRKIKSYWFLDSLCQGWV